jgi:hypothetical protein
VRDTRAKEEKRANRESMVPAARPTTGMNTNELKQFAMLAERMKTLRIYFSSPTSPQSELSLFNWTDCKFTSSED